MHKVGSQPVCAEDDKAIPVVCDHQNTQETIKYSIKQGNQDVSFTDSITICILRTVRQFYLINLLPSFLLVLEIQLIKGEKKIISTNFI